MKNKNKYFKYLNKIKNKKMENLDNNNLAQNLNPEIEEDIESQNEKMNNINQNHNQEEQDNEMNEEEAQDEESELMYIYEWVDSIELSRPKKNISRDFSDGVLLAEIIKSYFPHMVDLHNYPSCSNTKHKESNWNVLNNKVLKKLHIKLTKNEIESIVKAEPMAIEKLLQRVYAVLQEKVNMNPNNGNLNRNTFEMRNTNEKLRKTLEEKENVVKQLKDIVEVLELKLKNSEDMENLLQNKLNQLTESINKNGLNDDK